MVIRTDNRDDVITMTGIMIQRIGNMEKNIDEVIYDNPAKVLNEHYLPPFAAVQYLYYLGYWKEPEIDTDYNSHYIVNFKHLTLGDVQLVLDPKSGYRKGYSFIYNKRRNGSRPNKEYATTDRQDSPW